MFINPLEAISNKWITHPDQDSSPEFWDKFVQPNAIDFTVDTMYSINHDNTFVISEHGKQMRGGDELTPVLDRRSGIEFWHVNPNTVVDILSKFYVDIPEGVAVELIIRSTFSRNGLYLTSGIYDSAFKGHIGAALHNRSGLAKIGYGTRIGQIKFLKAEKSGVKYSGQYNHKKGTNWKIE